MDPAIAQRLEALEKRVSELFSTVTKLEQKAAAGRSSPLFDAAILAVGIAIVLGLAVVAYRMHLSTLEARRQVGLKE